MGAVGETRGAHTHLTPGEPVVSWRNRKPAGLFYLETMTSFISYLKNVRAELTHVVWPKPAQAVTHTILIVIISALIAVFIGVLDYVFTGVVSRFIIGF